MGSPPTSPNGNTQVRVTPVKGASYAGLMTSVAPWFVDVAPDHRTAPLRERARNADDWLQQTARRFSRRQEKRVSSNPDEHRR
jgi:hypothetical protein